MAIVLAGCFESNTPLDPELASELTSRLEGARRSVVTSRVKEEFRALFAKRYLECFPGGMKLQRSKRSTRLDYRPCSPSLLQQRNDGLSITIPDVLGLSSQFKRLTETWNSCIDDLADYSRARQDWRFKQPAKSPSGASGRIAVGGPTLWRKGGRKFFRKLPPPAGATFWISRTRHVWLIFPSGPNSPRAEP